MPYILGTIVYLLGLITADALIGGSACAGIATRQLSLATCDSQAAHRMLSDSGRFGDGGEETPLVFPR